MVPHSLVQNFSVTPCCVPHKVLRLCMNSGPSQPGFPWLSEFISHYLFLWTFCSSITSNSQNTSCWPIISLLLFIHSFSSRIPYLFFITHPRSTFSRKSSWLPSSTSSAGLKFPVYAQSPIILEFIHCDLVLKIFICLAVIFSGEVMVCWLFLFPKCPYLAYSMPWQIFLSLIWHYLWEKYSMCRTNGNYEWS